jgi:hypothetical protein
LVTDAYFAAIYHWAGADESAIRAGKILNREGVTAAHNASMPSRYGCVRNNDLGALGPSNDEFARFEANGQVASDFACRYEPHARRSCPAANASPRRTMHEAARRSDVPALETVAEGRQKRAGFLPGFSDSEVRQP